MRQSSFIL